MCRYLTDDQLRFLKADKVLCGHLSTNWPIYKQLRTSVMDLSNKNQMDAVEQLEHARLFIKRVKLQVGITAVAEERGISEKLLMENLARLLFHLDAFHDIQKQSENGGIVLQCT